MKFIKWKSLIITSIVCLLPILFGVALWQKLPDTMAIHFDINNNPDNFASKGFVVFGLPILMTIFQIFSCCAKDIAIEKYGNYTKFEDVVKWIIPVMSIVLQIATIGFALGWSVDIRRIAMILVGGIFVVTGICLPKFNYVKNYNIDAQKAKKINRFVGTETLILGILFLISVFFPPIASLAVLLLIIPYTIITIIYSIKITHKR